MPQVLTYEVTDVASGAEIWEPDELSSDVTILEGAMILVDASGSNRVITLPVAASNPGRMLVVKKIDNSVNTVTVDGNGSETVDGAANVVLTNQYDSVLLGTDGVEWFIWAVYP